MFGIFRRFLGGQKAADAVKNVTRSMSASVERLPSTEAASLEDFERESRKYA